MKSRNIRMLVEYDGTPYYGWQTQDGLPTVQGTLTAVLQRITGEADMQLSCAGRTDAGVHAYGQVANFLTHHPPEAKRFATALNFYLPETIVVHRTDEVPLTFDARQNATSKRYRYRIYEGPHPPATDRQRAWHVRRRLDLEHMRRAAAGLIGELNFESFRSTHCDAAHAVRTMHRIDIDSTARPPVGRQIDIVFHANAFCRHMCRILAGTLVEVGSGRRSVASMGATLAAQNRRQAGVTAPPWGLTLLEVFY